MSLVYRYTQIDRENLLREKRNIKNKSPTNPGIDGLSQYNSVDLIHILFSAHKDVEVHRGYTFVLFFFPHTHSIWKFSSQGSNPIYSCDPQLQQRLILNPLNQASVIEMFSVV